MFIANRSRNIVLEIYVHASMQGKATRLQVSVQIALLKKPKLMLPSYLDGRWS